MSDESQLVQREHKAAKVENLFRDGTLDEAFAAVVREYEREWRNTKPSDTEAREHIWLAINAVGRLKGHLRSILEDGKLARRQLNELAGKRTPAQHGIV